MLDQLLNSPTVDYATRGLRAATLRHEVIADNIANVNTPHFNRSEVHFEEMLAKELGVDKETKEREARMQVVRTHDRHLPPPRPDDKAMPTVALDEITTMRTDGNNVDIDREMASLAKNDIYYNALARKLGSYFQRVKNVITSR